MDRKRRTGSTIPTLSEPALSDTFPTRTQWRRLIARSFWILLLMSSCTFVPTFSTPSPPLLLHQEPETPPLFVLHPPGNTPSELFFTGHVRKEKSPEIARKKALAQALEKLGATLSQSGYPLSPEEQAHWLKENPGGGGPRIADSWARTYKQSSEQPYIHLTSLYLLLSVPATYLQKVTRALARKDRTTSAELTRLLQSQQKDLARGDGSRGLRDARLALEAARRIHSLHSFPQKEQGQVVREKSAAGHSWRRMLRGLNLALIPSQSPLILREVPNPPASLAEEVHIRIGHRQQGLSGLIFHGTLLPQARPEHLVFPPLTGIYPDPMTPFSHSTLFWETFLLRQPPYQFQPPLSLSCAPTGASGSGMCLIKRAHVPQTRGTLEGGYHPAAGTTLDQPFFHDLFGKTLIDIHFRFYHRRSLSPLLLRLPTRLDNKITQSASRGLTLSLGESGITLCVKKSQTLSCPEAPPGISLPPPSAQLVIADLRINPQQQRHSDFSVATVHLRMSVILRNSQGIFLSLPLAATGRGFKESSALNQAFREAGRRLARTIPLSYLPDRHPHPGDLFYDP